MNERIKELFGLAVEHTAAMDNGKLSELALNNICAERFANLIISECLGECIGVSCSNLNIGKLRDEGISMCMDEIRKLKS